jgi:CheY-like chemotaxis protein
MCPHPIAVGDERVCYICGMARILVVDDEGGVRSVIRRVLETRGHTVVEAGDGRTALALQAQEPVDLVITDLFMPDVDGLEVVRELRVRGPDVPVLVLSGGDTTGKMDLLQVAEAMGAKRVLSKPFEVDELLKEVEDALNP